MKLTSILSFGLAVLSAALAAPTSEQGDPLPKPDGTFALHVNSLAGNPRLFKSRPIVALSNGTIDGIPQNHAPQSEIHLPPTFGLENFTVHPASAPVTFTRWRVSAEGESWWALTGEIPTSTNLPKIPFIAQYRLPAPDNFIAVGWSTVFPDGGDGSCPPDVGCNVSWDIEGERMVLKPRGMPGSWDAVKTKEGQGWRIVWKGEKAVVGQGVEVVVVRVGD